MSMAHALVAAHQVHCTLGRKGPRRPGHREVASLGPSPGGGLYAPPPFITLPPPKPRSSWEGPCDDGLLGETEAWSPRRPEGACAFRVGPSPLPNSIPSFRRDVDTGAEMCGSHLATRSRKAREINSSLALLSLSC